MRNQAWFQVLLQSRFGRATSRCQKVRQCLSPLTKWGIFFFLSSALLLAVPLTANAQVRCQDAFASLNEPLKRGDTVVVRYAFSRAKPDMLKNLVTRNELLVSAENEIERLQEKRRVLHRQILSLDTNSDSIKTIAKRSEFLRQVKANDAQTALISKIAVIARGGGQLNSEKIELIAGHTFEQTFVLNKKTDAKLLSQRLGFLDENSATVEKVELPDSQIKRVYRVMLNHKVVSLVLVSVAAGLIQGAFQLYVTHQNDANNGVLTQLYDDGSIEAPQAPVKAHDDEREAVGN